MKNVILPELGEGITKVEISDVIIKEGDLIEKDDILIVVETEKASMEIPSTESGIVKTLNVKIGETISPGDIIISIENNLKPDIESNSTNNELDEDKNPAKHKLDEEVNSHNNVFYQEKKIPEINTMEDTNSISLVASPGIRKFARELGCDISQINGTGNKGRITREDIQNHVKINLQKPTIDETQFSKPINKEEIDFTIWGDVQKKDLNKIKLITGERLKSSWQNIPHVTQFDKADITELDSIRKLLKKINKDENISVSFIPFYIKALVATLQNYPEFNSSITNDGKTLIIKNFYNIGIAVDTPNGLMVPVIKNVDRKNIKKITYELSELSKKARLGKLVPEDIKGGSFTISSLGGIGGTYFTPIINPPEVAILGISKMKIEPLFINKKFKPRKMLPFSLSYDHRVIDGASAARFTKEFAYHLNNFKSLRQ